MLRAFNYRRENCWNLVVKMSNLTILKKYHLKYLSESIRELYLELKQLVSNVGEFVIELKNI